MDIKLDSKTILEKEFKTGMRGYNQEEVDLFLDSVIHDYESFKKRIAELERENSELQNELSTVQKRPASSAPGTTNFDLLKRISNLEKAVFGSKLSGNE